MLNSSYLSRARLGPVAASILAGFLGGAACDVIVTLARATAPTSLGGLLLTALGLYGVAGLVTGIAGSWLLTGVLRVIPDGPGRLVHDEALDRKVASTLLAGLVGLVALAAFAGLGQQALVRPMQSDKLATIASAGLVLIGAPLSIAIALALIPFVERWIAPRLPRPERVGTTGLLLIVGAVAGVLATVAAFSRADWRVLDLAPFVSLGVIVVAGVGHGLFWYRSAKGAKLSQTFGASVPTAGLSLVAVVGILVALGLASRLPESSTTFAAIDEGALGLRMAVRIARATTDHDGDGYSARFGGGDCDDRQAEVHPGAEDVPNNGIDENCEAGDSKVTAEEAGEDDSAGEKSDTAEKAPAAGGVAIAAAAKSGDEKPAATPKAAARDGAAFKGNILIITIDAFRADRLGVAGYGRPQGHSLTPNLDALAKRGAYFRRVWSQAPNTPRSFPSILTSQIPSSVKWDKPGVNYPIVLPSNHTVFEDLKDAGLAPLGIFSHFYFTPDRGIGKAFKEWSNDGAGTIAESNKDSASPRLVPQAIARLKKAAAKRERFVLWTHLFEPHSSYMVHKEFPVSGTSGVAGLMEKYDYEIAFVDQWVGKLLRAVEALGLKENTAVVIMADHGEAWGEHKSLFHGQDLFDEQLRIPLIIAVPGREPIIDASPVAAMDVAPTLLDLVGAPIPKSFRGRSLMPIVDGGSLPARPIYGELMPATAWPHHAMMMVDDDKKVIHRLSERRWEFYDLKTDPGEKRNLADDAKRKEDVDRLRAKLAAFEERKR